MHESSGNEAQRSNTDLDRKLDKAILERFGDGKRRSLDEIVAGLADLIPEEVALAAYEDGMEEGRQYGRRWAGTAAGKELARLIQCHRAWQGDWWSWAEQPWAGLSTAEKFFHVVRPRHPVSSALAWWAKVLDNPKSFESLKNGDEILVVGFAEGAIEYLISHASTAIRGSQWGTAT